MLDKININHVCSGHPTHTNTHTRLTMLKSRRRRRRRRCHMSRGVDQNVNNDVGINSFIL